MRVLSRVAGVLGRNALALMLAGAVGLLPASAARAAVGPSTYGTDFWLAFAVNAIPPTASLLLTGNEATTGTVTWPDSTTTAFTITPGTVSSVTVNNSLLVSGADGVSDKGIRVTAGKPITVYGLNAVNGTSDAFVAIPTTALGTRYRALTYRTTIVPYPGRLMVVGTANGTTVTITPEETLSGRPAGTPYPVALDAGEVYTATAPSTAEGEREVSGTLVSADKPVAVFAGVDCGNVGVGACDHLMEQMAPTTAWGTSFLLTRFAKTAGGDPVRVLADLDDTEVRVDGDLVATLDAGEFHEATLMTGGGNTGALVTTSKPAQVSQFMTAGAYVQAVTVSGDPSSLIVPPYQQFLSAYTLATAGAIFPFNAINIAIPTTAVASFRLDGDPVDPDEFAAIGSTGFSSAQLLVADGTHNLIANQPFGAFSYGAAGSNSYAYAGGASFAPVASIAEIEVTNPVVAALVDTQVCISGTVTDSEGEPVEGVRVDLTVTGTHADATDDATTNSSGVASLCYTGTETGTDTATLTAGSYSDTATVTWSTTPPAPRPPDAPPAPTVTAGDSAGRVGWTAPATNGSAITGYTVTARPGGLTCEGAASGNSCVVIGLTNGQRYEFTVVAHSGAGDSAASPATAGTPANEPGSGIDVDRPTIAVGGSITVTTDGFMPGSTVRFYIASTPSLLGTAIADADGVATLTVKLSGSLAGSHTISAVGTGASGEPLVETIEIRIASQMAATGDPILRNGAIGGALLLGGALLILMTIRYRRPIFRAIGQPADR